jgi:hypothetical protein
MVSKIFFSFPIVGVGASAGGLAAFEAFFSGMPADPGMAFVLVQHLAPDRKSILSELIRRYTRMDVFEGMGGKKAIGEIRKICPSTPAFVASGYSGDPIMANPEKYGFAASLRKPFMIAELSGMLEKHLKNHK